MLWNFNGHSLHLLQAHQHFNGISCTDLRATSRGLEMQRSSVEFLAEDSLQFNGTEALQMQPGGPSH
jgi:hypothetical protein